MCIGERAVSNRPILEQAHAKIQNKQYNEARQILQKIPSDPTAAKWIAKIDDILTREASATFTPKTRVEAPDIDLDRLASNPPKPAKNETASSPKILSVLYATMLIAGALVLVIAFAGEFLGDLFPSLQTHQDSRIFLAYSSEWSLQDMTTHGYCKTNLDECLYFAKTSPNVGFLVEYIPLSNYRTAAEMAENGWQSEVDDPVFIRSNRSLQDLTVAGFPAVAQFYNQSEKDENGGEFYMIDVYFADGLDGFIVNIFANTACNLAGKIGEVNTVLSSLRIASRNGGTAEDGFTPASPTALTIPAC